MQNRIIIVSIIAAWKYNKLIELNELFIYKDVNMTQRALNFFDFTCPLLAKGVKC